ncbi:MAG TPA: hypothetical protein P5250_00520 [Bacteroidales bacterium]|nr:hypothetical protein [Bacteroidales bacterium]
MKTAGSLDIRMFNFFHSLIDLVFINSDMLPMFIAIQSNVDGLQMLSIVSNKD